MSDDLIQVNAYRDWKGLNLGNSWWKNHDTSTMTNIENITPDLKLLDITTDPVINNVYTHDAGIDGSRFQYNNLAKAPINLKFWLHYTDHRDFVDKKHDIDQYFAAKAQFIMQTNYHPALHAAAHTAGFEGLDDSKSDHDVVFTVKMDNALGMWFTNSTSWIENNWDSYLMQDLRTPTDLGRPSWKLHPGENRIWIAGDVMSQLTNPTMDCKIWLYGVNTEMLTITNKTSNTKLIVDHKHNWTEPPLSGDYVFMNLNFGKVNSVDQKSGAIDYTPFNSMNQALDFWLDPGWNTIVLDGAASGYLDTRFYFAHY